jgi:hypothetical protein
MTKRKRQKTKQRQKKKKKRQNKKKKKKKEEKKKKKKKKQKKKKKKKNKGTNFDLVDTFQLINKHVSKQSTNKLITQYFGLLKDFPPSLRDIFSVIIYIILCNCEFIINTLCSIVSFF